MWRHNSDNVRYTEWSVSDHIETSEEARTEYQPATTIGKVTSRETEFLWRELDVQSGLRNVIFIHEFDDIVQRFCKISLAYNIAWRKYEDAPCGIVLLVLSCRPASALRSFSLMSSIDSSGLGLQKWRQTLDYAPTDDEYTRKPLGEDRHVDQPTRRPEFHLSFAFVQFPQYGMNDVHESLHQVKGIERDLERVDMRKAGYETHQLSPNGARKLGVHKPDARGKLDDEYGEVILRLFLGIQMESIELVLATA